MSSSDSIRMALLLLALGCNRETEVVPVSEPLEVLGTEQTIVLEETAIRHLARPSSLTGAPNGDLYVVDRLAGMIFRFGRDGGFRNTIGGKGAGPGEFESPRTVAFLGDSIVVGIDPGLHRAQKFGFDGEFRGSPLPLPFEFSMPAWGDGGIWFGGSSQSDNFALLRWDGQADSAARMFSLPSKFRSTPLLLLLGGATPLRVGNKLLVAFGNGDLYVADPLTGTVVDSVNIPVLRRRGLPREALELAEKGDGFGMMNASSNLTALGRLSDGGVAIAFRDLTRVGAGAGVGFEGTLFLTTLDSTLAPRCVDMPVELKTEQSPLLWFVTDTLLIFEQIVSAGDSVQSVVRRVPLIPGGRC